MIKHLPVYVPLSKATPTFGPSRSWFYRAAKKGQIILRKNGGVTLVDTASVLKFLSELPIPLLSGIK